jgi:hypothetical protein
MSETIEKRLSPDMINEQPRIIWSEENLSDERIHDLVVNLIPDEETRAGRSLGLHVIDGNDPNSDIGRYVEWKVLDEKFENNLEEMAREYGSYDAASVFLVVLDYEKQVPAAVLRIIKPTENIGFKSIKDLTSENRDVNPWYNPNDTEDSLLTEIGAPDKWHTADISIMGVMPAYRSAHSRNFVSGALYSSCIRWSLENDFNYWVTIVDHRILKMMQDWGEPFKEFVGKDYQHYLGSKASKPMHTELYSGLEKVKAFDQNIYDLYTKGTGLENIFVLPNFVLPESH